MTQTRQDLNLSEITLGGDISATEEPNKEIKMTVLNSAGPINIYDLRTVKCFFLESTSSAEQ